MAAPHTGHLCKAFLYPSQQLKALSLRESEPVLLGMAHFTAERLRPGEVREVANITQPQEREPGHLADLGPDAHPLLPAAD